jgi:hypothetical protein
VGGTQSLCLVGGNFKAKQKYAEFSLAKKKKKKKKKKCKNNSYLLKGLFNFRFLHRSNKAKIKF